MADSRTDVMKIGVDLHVIDGKYQGSRTYLEEIYREAVGIGGDLKYIFFVDKAREREDGWGEGSSFVSYNTKSKFRRLSLTAATLARKTGIDIFHFTYISPLAMPCRTVLSVHDILFETSPEFFTKAFLLRSKYLVKRSVKRASHIFTISSFSKNAIQEIYGVPEDKITITPCAVNPDLFNTLDRGFSARVVKEQYDIEEYILTVGRIEPRKNYENLIKAYAEIRKESRCGPRLVIVGKRDFGYKHVFELIAETGLESEVIVLEGVDNEMLSHLYKASLMFVYPSYAEGFGIPILEAMACGSPVICSNTTAMPEVVGSSGVMVNPGKVGELAEGIRLLLSDESVRSKYSTGGVERACKFSWRKSAEVMSDVYKNLEGQL